MKNFETKVRNRIAYRFASAIILLPLAVYALITYINTDGIISGTPVSDFIGGFFNGVRGAVVLGFIAYQVIRAIFDIKALKDKDKLKNLEIEENDERTILINELSSKTAYNISLFVIMTACLVLGLFNSAISITLLTTWVVIVLIRLFTASYYAKKL